MIAPGTILGGKYVVERVLGEGGMGVVVAAKHAQLGHRVAVKMMLAEGLKNADALARFEREARAAAELASDHVARVTDVGHFDDGSPYMVMEYLEGEDLAARIQREGPMPVGDVVRLFIQACIGLGDAHEHGIVHRDIKPSNLFLASRRGGRVTLKVLDFGIAKANLTSSDHNLTRTSAMMGSPQYMSPEQLRDTKNVDARTDLWSLGASVYEALTGVPAFPAETLAELHVKILMEPPVPTFRLRPEVPLELDDIVMRCLAKAPGERFRSMHELQQALELAEQALAVPRVAFQSNPAFLETAVPTTEHDTSLAKAFEAASVPVHSAANAPPSRGAPGAARSLPPAAAPVTEPLAAPLAATASPISQTMGGLTESAPLASPKPRVALAAGAGAALVVALIALKLATGGGAGADAAGAAGSGTATPAPALAEPRPAAVPSAIPAAPAPAPPSPNEAAAPSVVEPTAAPAVAAAAPSPAPRGAKKGSKAAAAPAVKAPAAAPAPAEAPAAPKPKKKSALDVELD